MPGGAVFHQVLYNNALTALLGLRGALDTMTDPDSANIWAKEFGSNMVCTVMLKSLFPTNASQVRVTETGKAAGEEPTDHDDVIDLVAEACRRIGDFATVDWILFAPDLVRGVEDTLRQLDPGQSLGSLRGSMFNSGTPDSPDSAEPPPELAVPSPSETLSVPGMSRSSSSGSSAAQPPQPTSVSPAQAGVKRERPIQESARRKVSQPSPSLLVMPPASSVSMPPPLRTSPGRVSPTSTSAGPVLVPSPIHLAPVASSSSTPSSKTQDGPAVAPEDEPSFVMGERPARHLWKAVSFFFYVFIDALGSSLSFQCERCSLKRIRCVPTADDTFPYGACYHCKVLGCECVNDFIPDAASEAAIRDATVDYHAPPGFPPTSTTHTIPFPPTLFHFSPEAVPLYGNKDAPLRDLLFWYEEIFHSRRESQDSRTAHDAAVACKAADKKAYEASCAMERTARDRVYRADSGHPV